MIMLVTFGLLLLLIGLTIPVAAALGILGLALDEIFSVMPLRNALGNILWSSSIEFLLVAIPMFILLGEIILRARIAGRMYAAMAQWFSWLPGGLMHSNIGSSALFAATSGSSIATAATVGTVAVPEMDRHGYNRRLFLGSLAAGGTLGILIPPSMGFILYGLLTNTSVPQLYLAGLIPGLALAGLFMAMISVLCMVRPGWSGAKVETDWRRRIESLPDLVPPLVIFAMVVGSIYAGLATPTEAAALGVVGALGLALMHGELNLRMLRDAVEGTMRTTAMIIIIVLAAAFLNFVLAMIGLASGLQSFVRGLDLSPLAILLVVIAIYLVLGCFMESMSMLILTTPIVVPMITAIGYDPVWFGVVMMILLEAALITPPIGMNLFVVHSLQKKGSLQDVALGAMPFFLAMLAMLVLLICFPQIALWLPRLLY